MKKLFALALSVIVLMGSFVLQTSAEYTTLDATIAAITANDDGVTWIDAMVDDPNDFKSITGFQITYKLTSQGFMGESVNDFGVNALMIAHGAKTSDDFGWELGDMPKFLGPAREIVTHISGECTYLGNIFFKKCLVEPDETKNFSVGDSITLTYNGNYPVFSDTETSISAHPDMQTEVEIESVTWLKGAITEERPPEPTWERVPYNEYFDLKTFDDGTDSNYVDIMVPEGDGPFPVVMWVHGGGWSMNDRKSFIVGDTIQYLIYSGYAVVSAEYSLCENTGEDIISAYPNMIYDLKAAVRFIRANGDKYNLDTSFIASMGESAGGHLSMLLGTTNGSESHEDLSMGNAEFSSDIQAMISYFGPSDITVPIMGYAIFGLEYTEEMGKHASPYYQLTDKAPPLFMTHGEDDGTVPPIHSQMMEEKYTEILGAENITTKYYENGPHGSVGVFDSQETMDLVLEFMNKHLDNHKNALSAETVVEEQPIVSTEPITTETPESTENTAENTEVEVSEESNTVLVIVVVTLLVVAILSVVVVFFFRGKKKNRG